MKQINLLIIICATALSSLAQPRMSAADSSLVITLASRFQTREADYVCDSIRSDKKATQQAVNSATFDSLFKPIFSKVVLNNKDLVSNGSAYALSFSKEQATFSINYNNQSASGKSYWNFGFQASTTDKFLKLFSKDEWQRGLGLSVGQTIPFGQKIVFEPKDCEALQKKRMTITPLWIETVRKILMYDTLALNRQVEDFERNTYTAIPANDIHTLLDRMPVTGSAEYAALKARLDSIATIRRQLGSNKETDNLINTFVANFEQQSFKKFGYNIRWFNWRLMPEYKGVNIYDTSFAKTAGIERKDFFRVTLEGTFNFMYHRENRLIYLTAGLSVKNTNYLEGKNASDITQIVSDVPGTDNDITKTVEATVVADYEKFKQQFLLAVPSVGLTYFFGKSRIVGVDLLASTKLKAMAPKEIDFEDLFTLRAGLLFSFKGKSDLSNSTVGIIATWEDMSYNKPTIKDNFTLGLRLGIPFSY